MNSKKYTLDNWRELLSKDWQYLKQDNGTGNIENIILQLFKEVSKELNKVNNIIN